MKDHLSNRFQRVTVRDTLSNWHSISNDVTHGSILGPLLFNIFMNDLSCVIITSLVNLSNQIQLRERANRSRKKNFPLGLKYYKTINTSAVCSSRYEALGKFEEHSRS